MRSRTAAPQDKPVSTSSVGGRKDQSSSPVPRIVQSHHRACANLTFQIPTLGTSPDPALRDPPHGSLERSDLRSAGVGWNPASNSEEGGREGGRNRSVARGEDSSELRLGLMSTILVKGCKSVVSGCDSKTLAPEMGSRILIVCK